MDCVSSTWHWTECFLPWAVFCQVFVTAIKMQGDSSEPHLRSQPPLPVPSQLHIVTTGRGRLTGLEPQWWCLLGSPCSCKLPLLHMLPSTCWYIKLDLDEIVSLSVSLTGVFSALSQEKSCNIWKMIRKKKSSFLSTYTVCVTSWGQLWKKQATRQI